MAGLQDAYTVILAGGIGSRFWPASTPTRPKQLLPLAGPEPLIVETLNRANRLVGPERVLVVTSDRIAAAFTRLRAMERVGTLVEPVSRSTGPALTWAAHELERRAPGSIMISMHADHLIRPFEGLRDTLEQAATLCAEGRLCCVAVRPDRPETGYGYVELGDTIEPGAYRVRRFTEKPDAETAEGFVAGGRHFWNTGIFVWRPADLLAAVERHAPEIATGLPALREGDVRTFFELTETVSIDVAVLERADNVAAIEARFAWDDVGVWNAIARTRGVDERGNAVVGPGRVLDAEGNVVWAESRRVNAIGVADLLVVEANGEILVMPLALAPDLKALRQRLEGGEPGPGEGA